ncbi:PBP1A family penicillin-binding protein [Virgibacillus sp. C22-A2]|uniref:PBP1A family penicillin-binding protein n=1 Tax=Virgibacillus tibetensis TaxID=3042313 RepID=A0ABU6KAY5_9BACI|nr:PBP1A family penicillin-binding protein [Virgibacillus sp. C22-A2]
MADNSQSRTARRKQKKSTKKPIWKKILLIVLIVFLALGIGVGTVAAYWIATAPEIDAAKLTDPFPSELLDKDGEVYGVLGTEKRTKAEYDELPQVLVDAVIATEDSRFFEHSGIDMRRIGGAIVANVTRGFGSEGASTITQQVVENAFLSSEKKISLKVQEQWLSLKLEREYTKEQILEMYLNKIFYGSHAYGVAKASETYFGKKDLNDLTLPEAAILAGLPQRPTAYNPFENPDLTEKRMNTVLTLMVRHGKISQEEADEARNVDITSLLTDTRPQPTPYEAFLKQVEDEVSEKVEGADIYSDGLKIHTTIDTSVQDHVEYLLTDSEANPIPYPDDEMQAGMVVLDTKNGAIRAIGGRRNSNQIREYNYAIQGGQQPGSTFKPILSYGPAIEHKKMSTYHQINDDKPYEVGGSSPIRNWNRAYGGWMSARHAMNQSLNVPAVKTLDETGYAEAKSFAEGLGINFADDQITIRDAIGGSKTNVTPLQLAGAYRAFGNEGIYNEPYAVTMIEFPDGKTVDLKPEPEAAMSDYTAYMITDMLKTVVTDGTGTPANVPGLQVAGKTGTTSLEDESGSPDSWFSGYTTNYTISIWTGGYTNDDGKRAAIPDGHTRIPHALFKNTMEEISKGIETADFIKPDSVVEVGVEKGSNPARLPSDYTPSSEIVTELFVKGTEPAKTSEKFDELDPVSGLKAKYDEDSNSVHIEWDYDSDEDVSFEVSASVNGGQMQSLSSTSDNSLEISEVEIGAEYEIQVIAVSNDNNMKSEPRTTTVRIPEEDEDEEEDEENEGNIPSVSGLSANYNDSAGLIDVSWNYNGPPATFEVSVNGQTETVQSNGIEISNASPGQKYTITVTPIGQNGANSGVRGDPQSTEVTVPEESNGNDDDENGEEDEEEEEEEEDEEENENNSE